MIRVGIIGVSGRNINHNVTEEHMKWMADNVECYIKDVLETTNDKIILVSGGSACSDHVAVQLYLEGGFAGLELYLPTKFNLSTKKFETTHEGNILNFLHSKCKTKTGRDVLSELSEAITNPNVKVVIGKGFFARNTMIAEISDHLLAFTFGEGDTPIDGGTYDTWKKTKHHNKLHLSLDLV